jgi:hypothetical protein
MVGVGRNLSPDTGSGGELYAVIGHAPRHLDRNIALVGRVVSGFEAMSSLPRGTEALGFYKERTSDVPIVSANIAADLRAAERPRFEYLAGPSFAAYLRTKKPAGRFLHSSCRRGRSVQCQRAGETGPGKLGRVSGLVDPISVLNDNRTIVMAHTGLGQRQRRCAEGAFGRHPANQPLGPAAAQAMIHFMLAIDDVVSAPGRIMSHLQVAQCGN